MKPNQTPLILHSEFSGDVMQFTITADVPHWYKYVLCGVKGVQEQFCSVVTNGFKAMVDGTVPRSAGLSSSSALVCCASLAMLKANQWPMTKVRYKSNLSPNSRQKERLLLCISH